MSAQKYLADDIPYEHILLTLYASLDLELEEEGRELENDMAAFEFNGED